MGILSYLFIGFVLGLLFYFIFIFDLDEEDKDKNYREF